MQKLQCSDSLAIPQPAGQCLTPIKYIGAGANGFVLKVLDESNKCYALKIVPVIARPNDEKAASIKRERQFYEYLAHTDIMTNVARATTLWSVENVETSTYFTWNKALRARLGVAKLDYASRQIKDSNDGFTLCIYFVQMECYTSGNLMKWLEGNSDKCAETYAVRVELFCNILSAIDFLHTRGLMHRDICPNNIFLTMENDQLHAVLGDFDSIVSCGGQATWPLTKVREKFTRNMGTDPYAAPEIYGGNYDKQCDLYSVGVVALNLFFNILDYNQLHDALYSIREKNVFPACICADKKKLWQDILKTQLSGAPERRLSGCELLKLVAKERRTRKQSLYVLQWYHNAHIKLKDVPFASGSLLGWFSRSNQASVEELSRMPDPKRAAMCVAACKGKMYVIGGYDINAGKVSNIVQQFDSQTGWQDWPPMLEQREHCGAAVLGGRLFAVGGYDGNRTLSSAEECDLETGRWAQVTPMTAARDGVGVAALGNLLFAVNGVGLNSVEWYDPRAGRWTKATPMHELRRRFGCAALGDRLYVAGGLTINVECMASVEWFDLRAGRWTRVRDMGAPRSYFALAELNGQLLAAGGVTNGDKKLDTVEMYDEKRDTWSTLDIRLPRGGWCVGCGLEE